MVFWVVKLDNLVWNLGKDSTNFKTSKKILHLFRVNYCYMLINMCSPKSLLIESLGLYGSCQDTCRLWMWTSFRGHSENWKNMRCQVSSGVGGGIKKLAWKRTILRLLFCIAKYRRAKLGRLSFRDANINS